MTIESLKKQLDSAIKKAEQIQSNLGIAIVKKLNPKASYGFGSIEIRDLEDNILQPGSADLDLMYDEKFTADYAILLPVDGYNRGRSSSILDAEPLIVSRDDLVKHHFIKRDGTQLEYDEEYDEEIED